MNSTFIVFVNLLYLVGLLPQKHALLERFYRRMFRIGPRAETGRKEGCSAPPPLQGRWVWKMPDTILLSTYH